MQEAARAAAAEEQAQDARHSSDYASAQGQAHHLLRYSPPAFPALSLLLSTRFWRGLLSAEREYGLMLWVEAGSTITLK